MRIAHVCLAAFYIDGYGYQENILPRVHRKMGHEVEIIASTETYIDKAILGYVAPSSYQNEDGILVHRLPYARWCPKKIRPKIRAYRGLRAKLDAFQPDLIFLHDMQFWDILVIRSYAMKHEIPVHADSHTDFVNSARGFVSRRILHGIFYRILVQFADPVVRRYFPTLPARADFMHEVYGLRRDKMELLPFGFDDTSVAGVDRAVVRQQTRARLGIPQGEIVLVTGGKLDLRKNIHSLINRFSKLRRAGQLPGVHLVVFGKPNPVVEAKLAQIDIDGNVHMRGWMKPTELYTLFWASDAAIFPGTHSVVWEEAIGHGLASAFHRWKGMEHLDLGGNALFIDDAEDATLDDLLLDLTRNDGAKIYQLMETARRRGPSVFSFSQIARNAIET
jgi:1,2-diacylglycerol 3-alpha-glucosyltransferase